MSELTLVAHSAAQSHPGHCREINEDSVFSDADHGLWAVADGMGGYAAGDTASQLVVRHLKETAQALDQGSLNQNIDRIKSAINQANHTLHSETTLPQGCQHIGTTLAALTYHPVENRCACLWVGDSRIYVLRDGQLYQLTKDHSVVQELIDNGLLDPMYRESHPQSHVITRAIGTAECLDVDVVTFQPAPGDLFCICSDGLYNEMDHQQILECLLQKRTQLLSEQAFCDGVASELLTLALQTEAKDNVSINIISLI